MALDAAAPRSVTILGATGSVGCSTVDLIERHPDRFVIEALTARSNVARLAGQARRLQAKHVVIADESRYVELREAVAGTGISAAAGEAAVAEAASMPADWVMSAIVGAAGLEPTLAAVKRGAIVALANKECLVCAGKLFMTEVREHGATLLPVDSEHSAIYQVFDFMQADRVEKIILTASGGPFRAAALKDMAAATPRAAVAHPNWSMGAKISVDSATMMNKGLEMIEAYHLFPVRTDQIEVVVHPQSIIHSMVCYQDGSVLAQLGTPDMRTPIAYALGWPRRMSAPAQRLDLVQLGKLTFEAPDTQRFPALRLAREALHQGGGAPTILNAANEVAVAGFLAGAIGFLDIAHCVEHALGSIAAAPPASLADVRALDAEARRIAGEFVKGLSARGRQVSASLEQ
ncbi:MAG TPA: 1-deoxy-D-xylulose-5-phosphate reductoisomerase [Alphaproteobacteria bacterium]|nr:1-deoxy-D-xylulose-5-phosphate reductoisomerase [Alphaproteobacteria bacterium]